MNEADDIPEGAPFAQVGALPYRVTKSGAVEVLLITSRDTGRWVIPKGWGMKNKTEAQAAAIEAQEEAGMKGAVGKRPLGTYHYSKALKSGAPALCQVTVYPLAVKRQVKKWKEQGQRTLQWFAPAEAASHVAEPELAALIAAFKPD
jgi:8-oxo-dGTP pyrophosphatase MutT (NUDIX family)